MSADMLEADGWEDVDPAALTAQAVEAVAWGLLDQTSDLADREPSREALDAARATARRYLGQRASTDATLAKITALTTAALAERRRGCPTYGLVSAARVLELVEEART